MLRNLARRPGIDGDVLRWAPWPVVLLSTACNFPPLPILGVPCEADRTCPEDNGDRAADELAAIQPQPHSAVCSPGVARFACKARVRTDGANHIKSFATPSGLGPADLASAYKLDPSKTSTATVA